MNQTIQYNTKTFETLNSQESLLGGMTGGLAASFQSNLSVRMAEAMKKHTSLQFKWLKQIERINGLRDQDDFNTTHARKLLNKKLRKNSLGSLIERQSTFKYDEMGSKQPSKFWAHKSPKRNEENPADLQNRVNFFYQNVRGSDVAFVTTHTKNPKTMLWSTSPTGRRDRGQATKKDIANLPVPKKKSNVFRGYNKTIVPPDTTFSSKVHLDAKKGRFIADLRQRG